MKYRRIIDGEPQFGQSRKDFLQGADAIAQAICTRLKLFTNEWWEDVNDGLPLWTDIIGKGGNTNKDKVTALITNRILETKLDDLSLVSNLKSVVSNFDGNTRRFTYTGNVVTIYGVITITNEGI
jgi:hypothetical protein